MGSRTEIKELEEDEDGMERPRNNLTERRDFMYTANNVVAAKASLGFQYLSSCTAMQILIILMARMRRRRSSRRKIFRVQTALSYLNAFVGGLQERSSVVAVFTNGHERDTYKRVRCLCRFIYTRGSNNNWALK